jgi:eukaryotic-like serine/threonine-protein kinase
MPILTEEERVGTLLGGRYRLDAILGRGGTGVVFDATHSWTGRRVAVKLLKPEYSRDLSLTRRFLQEARAAANLVHPNVVSVLDMGNEDDGAVHLVLERLDGESLGAFLEREKKLSPKEALSILVPIMDALCLAHRQGIIHRDLKPDNVYLHHDGAGRRVPKLLDFGMAKMVDAAWGSATQTGTLVGTPFYMSPEQAEGRKEQGAASDVWSMGVIFYRCLTGTLPFWADTPTKLLIEIVKAESKPLRERAPEIPESIAAAIDRALVESLSFRYADMDAFLEALRAAAAREHIPFPVLPDLSDTPPAEPFDPGPRSDPAESLAATRRARVIGWSVAALAVALVGVGILAATLFGSVAPASRAEGSHAVVEPPVAASAPSSRSEGEPDPTTATHIATVDDVELAGETDGTRGSESEGALAVGSETREPSREAAPTAANDERQERATPIRERRRQSDAARMTVERRGSRGMQLPGVATEW